MHRTAVEFGCRVIPDAGHGRMGDDPAVFCGSVAELLAG
jgi:hypothetical protein